MRASLKYPINPLILFLSFKQEIQIMQDTSMQVQEKIQLVWQYLGVHSPNTKYCLKWEGGGGGADKEKDKEIIFPEFSINKPAMIQGF